MKTLLTLFAFIPLMVSGQAITSNFLTTGIDSIYSKPNSDTTAVILLVSDTAKQYGNQVIQDYVFWLRGYEVTATTGRTVGLITTYLDSKKKPINYLVWEARKCSK